MGVGFLGVFNCGNCSKLKLRCVEDSLCGDCGGQKLWGLRFVGVAVFRDRVFQELKCVGIASEYQDISYIDAEAGEWVLLLPKVKNEPIKNSPF